MNAPDTMTLLDARREYFDANGFGPRGGYDDNWVTLAKIGPLRLGIPNTASRVHAVRYHDLHHVLTGYQTDLLGEAEIAAWELATGCRDQYAAWVLNLLAMPMGAVRHHPRLEQAFARGEHARNLYGETFDDALLEQTVGQARHRLDIDPQAEAPLLSPDGRARLRRFLALGVAMNFLIALVGLATLAGIAWFAWWLLGRG